MMYKCRVECTSDIDRMMHLLGDRVVGPIKIEPDTLFPDAEVIFEAPNHTRKELIEVLKTGMDLHVADETLELLKYYTGVRWRQ